TVSSCTSTWRGPGCRTVSSPSVPADASVSAQPGEGGRGRSLLAGVRALLVRVRGRSRLADRTVQAVDDYLDAQGSLLSAGMTYYGFLALFPLLAVALGIASVLSRVVPAVDETLRRNLAQVAPNADLDSLSTAGIAVGIV